MGKREPTKLSWRVLNATASTVDVDIFDVIGDPWGEGTTGADFVKEMRALDPNAGVRLHINSPGGYVNDALAMFAAIQGHPGEVTAYVESQAASAASFVAMAADRVVIAKHAQIMIHDAHGLALGNAADMRALAAMLDEESDNIAAIYAGKTGEEPSVWRDRMRANGGIGSTYRGQAAVDIGLADEVGVASRNVVVGRIAAQATEPAPETPVIDPALIPPLANGYRKPIPADLSRLVAANIPTGGR
jgi:ATP-dependent protease ClpP protease subunit